MPAALDVDREAVKMLVMEVGVRGAARAMGLPEATVAAWSARGKWIESIPRSQPLPPSMVQSLASGAISPSAALGNTLKSLNNETRLQHAIAQAEVAREVASRKASVNLEDASNVKASIQSAAILHGWSANAPVTRISLHVSGHDTGLPDAGTTVDAEWAEVPEPMDDVAFN